MSIFSLFSQSLVKENFVFFDVETTGLFPLMQDRVIEIAMIKSIKGSVTDTFTTMINPEKKIPPEATNVNSITNDMVADAPVFDKALAEKIIDFIGDSVLVAHNASFDLGFISTEFARNGITFDRWKAIDTLKIAKAVFPGQKNKLESIMRRYNIMPEGDFHRALVDTDALRKIFFEFTEEAEIRTKNLDQIIKEYGYSGLNIHRYIPAHIRESIVENKKISGKYRKRDGNIIDLSIIPIAPVWIDNKWLLFSYDVSSNRELTLYCDSFIEFF